jgi:hypothetical protein
VLTDASRSRCRVVLLIRRRLRRIQRIGIERVDARDPPALQTKVAA